MYRFDWNKEREKKYIFYVWVAGWLDLDLIRFCFFGYTMFKN